MKSLVVAGLFLALLIVPATQVAAAAGCSPSARTGLAYHCAYRYGTGR